MRYPFSVALAVVLARALVANAQPAPPPQPQAPQPQVPQVPQVPQPQVPQPQVPQPQVPQPQVPTMPGAPAADASLGATATAPTPEAKPDGPKQPKRGDYDAGGQARFPSGPDENGEYASFNWVAVDLKARYFLLDSVTINATAPLAVKKPDMLMTGVDPRLIGGMSVTLDARLPELPKSRFVKYETEVGLLLTGAMMREGAMLLSDKDFPLYTGDFEPAVAGGLRMNLKLSNAVDFRFVPTFAFQTGEAENLTALQVPLALVLKAGSVLKLSADAGVYTGDDISLRPSNGGRISLGAAIDVKVGPIVAHAGAGFASLLTADEGLYPTIGDSVYVDLNAKWAK